MRPGLDAVTARRRFLLLRGLRWLPTGLIVPVLILLLTDRGFSLAQIGLVVAAQGVMVLVLELPTGGLADALGRRPVLLAATAFEVASLALLVVADSLALLIVVFAIQGVYRALESGPLDAWYVDAALAADGDADVEGGLAAGGVVLGVAMSLGALAGGAIVALDPVPGIDALAAPLLVAIVLRVVELVALAVLVVEIRAGRGLGALRRSVREVPGVIAGAGRLLRGSHVLVALVAVELLWGFGMTTWENLLPPRLAAEVGGNDRAGALLGPAAAAAWLASAAGAAVVPALRRLLGAHWAAAAMRLGQGATVLGMAFAAGPIGVIAAYLATYAIHGAANPVHQGLLHRAVDSAHRTTMVSANSMTAMSGGAVGGIVLGALADATSVPTAMVAGAMVLAAATPLYLLARGHRDTGDRAPALERVP